MINKVLKTNTNIFLASKIGADPNPNGKIPIKLAQRPEDLRKSIENNLRSLGLDAGPSMVSPEGNQVVDIDDQMATMIDFRNEGKIGAIGLSGVTLDVFKRAVPAEIAAVQNVYSLISREFERLLVACSDHKVAWIPFFPFGGNVPGWPKVSEHQEVIKIAQRLSLTPSQVGLSWLLQHAPNIFLIPETANIEHLQENINVSSIVLDDTAIANLNDLAGISN
ncbi:Predicted oxidoreductase [Pedobacter hartonius]|uniref:Predicted oxidoreductase n=2 Tax=Pedobacter hartonius TaxID=425514 RepID=A0A1H4CGN0_9SPHI|nr:Predicted oxidoreductase [Pedobacter hartonius]